MVVYLIGEERESLGGSMGFPLVLNVAKEGSTGL
jgi:hypothetical protein